MKILIIDDHELFRNGIQIVLKQLAENIELFEADSYESSINILLSQESLDLILLDLSLPGLSDCEALIAVKKAHPFTPVVILSGNDTATKIEEIMNSGAQGYIPKSSSADILINA